MRTKFVIIMFVLWLGAMLPAADIPSGPSYLFVHSADGQSVYLDFETIEHVDPNWYQVTCGVEGMKVFNHAEAFRFLTSKDKWLQPNGFDLRDFSEYAKRYDGSLPSYEPPVVPEPNLIVCTSLASKYYHKCRDCRYYRDTMIEINVIELLLTGKASEAWDKQPCPWCKPIFYED